MSELLRNNLIMYPKALLRISVVILNNIYCIPTYVIWMTLLLPVKRYHPDLYYKIEGLFFHWLLSLVAMWSYTAGYDVVELGDDITPCRKKNTKTLVIANHQSTADVPLMMSCFNAKPDILPNIMWIMERLFKYTNFGIVSLIHQDFFISSGKDNRESSIKSLKEHIEKSFIPRMRNWMVLFPEGGFLRKRREISKRFAEKNNLPDLDNVSLPRVGALKAIFSVLPPRNIVVDESDGKKINNISNGGTPVKQITTNDIKLLSSSAEAAAGNNNSTIIADNTMENGKIQDVTELDDDQLINPIDMNTKTNGDEYLDYILDITIAYPQGKPLDLPTIVHGMRNPFQTHFLYRLYHTSEIPKEEDALTNWLYNRWTEKEKILKDFYTNGKFQFAATKSPVIVQQDMLRFLIINIFFITSSYVHMQMFYLLLSYCQNMYVFCFT